MSVISILLVEDSTTSIMLVKSLLKETKGEVDLHVAKTLGEAREYLIHREPDLILLDLNLPDSDGLATVESIYNIAKSTPIVVLTGTSDEAVGLQALKKGAQDFLVKDETYRKILVRAIQYAIERKKSEQELRDAKEYAEAVTLAKSQFIANLSHEFRTPLNTVMGFAEMISSGISNGDSEKIREYARDIHRSGEHLLGIVGTIFDLSKIEIERLELHEGKHDILDIVYSSIVLSHKASKDEEHEIKVNVPDGFPKLFCDKVIIERVLVNLLTNAIKFSSVDEPISVEAFLTGKGAVGLRVEDKGIGIPAQEIPKILEPFHRVKAPETQDIEGSGLGMPLVKGMVEAHGGTLRIDSELGAGTTVTVIFPSERSVPA